MLRTGWLQNLAPRGTKRHHRRAAHRPVTQLALVHLEERVAPSVDLGVLTPHGILDAQPGDWTTRSDAVGGSEVDVYQFEIASKSGVFLDIDARDTGSSLDSVLTVVDATTGVVVGSNDNGYDFQGFLTPTEATHDATSPDSSLYLDLAPGTYEVRVTAANGTTGSYDLHLLADASYASSVPVFNSNPGASDTLYLDFDGHASSNDLWAFAFGAYSVDPYDFDGNSSQYSPAEQLAIYNAWSVASEDYSSFNINVTTVDPGYFGNGQAFRMVVTDSPATTVLGPGNESVLGVSFLGSYATNVLFFQDNTAFTFAGHPFLEEMLGGGSSGTIMAGGHETGDVISHEFGHALQLEHYSSEEGGANGAFLPNAIMATPLLGLSRAGWAAGTNASGAFQDDMAIISSSSNAIGYRADDHGSTTSSATPLDVSGGSASASGIIERTTDLDYFSFLAAGTTTITVDVNEYLNNLDPTVRLLRPDGSEVAQANPPGSFDASLTWTLTPGTYLIEVSGGGVGNAGNAGRYTVRVETSSDLPPTVAITSHESGEAVAGNVTFTADASDDKGVDQVELFVDGASIGIDMNGADGWSIIAWDSTSVPDGSHTVTATATDTAGQQTSSSISVLVDNVDSPPAVAVSSPADGTAFAGTSLAITATASDDRGVTQVVFLANGAPIGTDSDGSDGWTLVWDVGTAVDGSYSLTARAKDTADQTTTSAATGVILDRGDPTVAITSPTGGEVSGAITIEATASDGTSGVARVEFIVNGASIGVDADGSDGWSVTWDTTEVGNGPYTLTARATDRAGNSADAQVSIDVNNPTQEVTLYYFTVAQNATFNGQNGTFTATRQDIVQYNPVTGEYSLFFDGSEHGLSDLFGTLNIDAFSVLSDTEILLSFSEAGGVLPPHGTGAVWDDADIVKYDSSAPLGQQYSLFFDGSARGLTGPRRQDLDIDAVELLADGTLLVSTTNDVSVPGVSGTVRDEDVLAFKPTAPGNYSSGTWSLYFDGSARSLSNSSEDVDAFAVLEGPGGPTLYLSTQGNFSVPGVSGGPAQIFTYSGGYGTDAAFDPVSAQLAGKNIVGFDVRVVSSPAPGTAPALAAAGAAEVGTPAPAAPAAAPQGGSPGAGGGLLGRLGGWLGSLVGPAELPSGNAGSQAPTPAVQTASTGGSTDDVALSIAAQTTLPQSQLASSSPGDASSPARRGEDSSRGEESSWMGHAVVKDHSPSARASQEKLSDSVFSRYAPDSGNLTWLG